LNRIPLLSWISCRKAACWSVGFICYMIRSKVQKITSRIKYFLYFTSNLIPNPMNVKTNIRLIGHIRLFLLLGFLLLFLSWATFNDNNSVHPIGLVTGSGSVHDCGVTTRRDTHPQGKHRSLGIYRRRPFPWHHYDPLRQSAPGHAADPHRPGSLPSASTRKSAPGSAPSTPLPSSDHRG